MEDPKQLIALECQQVQEQLLGLLGERCNLQREFEKLTKSSHHLMQQIQEDTSYASERKLNNYEAEKRRIEEKLEALESDIQEKDKRIALLDAKAGDYLLQVSTTSNNLNDNTEKVETTVDGEEGRAVTVGNGVKSDDQGSSVGGNEGQVESLGNAEEANEKPQVVSGQVGGEEGEDKKVEQVSEDKVTVGVVSQSSEEIVASGEEESEEGEESGEVEEEEEEEEEEKVVNHEETVENGGLPIKNMDENCQLIESDSKNTVESKANTVNEEIVLNGSGTSNAGKLSKANSDAEESQLAWPAPPPPLVPLVELDGSGKQCGNSSVVDDQVTSLSFLVAELRRVKDDMGKCMTVKEQSFIDLEDQLQEANREVNVLKISMSVLSKDLEEKEEGYQVLESENQNKKMDIEHKMTEIQEMTNKCSMLGEEKTDLLRKMEVLELMMTEYRTEIEMLIGEKTEMEQQTKLLLAARTTASTAEAEIDSRTSVEEKEREIEELVEKIQSMEQQMKELNDKLKVTNRHLKVMAREREYKQRECEILKRKVELVELKMCELQGTFDMLVKAVMKERDDVVKEMEQKTVKIDDLEQTIVRLKDTQEQELEAVLYEKKLIQDDLDGFKSGELQSSAVSRADKEELERVTLLKEQLETEVKNKAEENQQLDQRVINIQNDMTDFVRTLKDEMARLREDGDKTREQKATLAETFSALQKEHLEVVAKHQTTEQSFQELQKSNKEKSENLEALQLQLDDLQRQLEELGGKNTKLVADMASKEEEFREELSARERTIQELNVTLTNNQKQSMENYNALQEDMSMLQAKFKHSVEENKKQFKETEDRLKQSEEEKGNEIKALEEKVKSLMEEVKEKTAELTAQSSAQPQGAEVASPQDPEVPSSSASSLPTDTPTPDTPASHSQAADGECREAEDKQKVIDTLNQRVKELTETLEAAKKKDQKTSETNSEGDISGLHKTIKDLTTELQALKGKSQDINSGPFKNQPEFEEVIAGKEGKINTLESKVGDLEMCLANKSGYITLLEDKLKGATSTPESSEPLNNAETHLQQINKLSTDITKLKKELEQTYQECSSLKSTVTQLESDKRSIEDERAKLKREFETQLQQANGSLDDAKTSLEQKKNSVERLELELSTSSRSYVEEVARLESNHVVRVAELVKLHKHKVEELKALNAAKISEMLRHIEDTCKEKEAIEEELKNLTLEQYEGTSDIKVNIMQERDSLQNKVLSLEKTIELLDREKLKILEEKKSLKKGFEDEQTMAMEMQTQMITDLETLILNLETDKEALEKEVEKLKFSCDQQCETIMENEKKLAFFEEQIIIIAKEKDILVEEIKKLKKMIGDETVMKLTDDQDKYSTMEELRAKMRQLEASLENSQVSLEEQEQLYAEKLQEEKDSHIARLTTLRMELGEEVEVMEDQREQVTLEYQDRISLVIAQYQEQLTAVTDKYEAKLTEEKAEFGRVLVAKINEYQVIMAEQAAKLNSYEAKIETFQCDLDEKMKTIEELESSLDDMMIMRAALKTQVDDLKFAANEGSCGSDSKMEPCLDLMHSDYEARLAEMQEQYEAQLSYLRSLIDGPDYDARTGGCSSPSQDSEYSIELSCLRPYLQTQSSPMADFMAELRSQSVQDSHALMAEDTEVHASSVSCYVLTTSSSGVKSKEEVRSYSSADGKFDVSLSSLRARLRTKSIAKAKAKCRSNGSIPQLFLNSTSRSELRLLQSSLGKSEPKNSCNKKYLKQLQQLEKPIINFPTSPTQSLGEDNKLLENAISVNRNSPPPITTGAKPKPPCRLSSKLNKVACDVQSDTLVLSTATTLNATTTTATTLTTTATATPSTNQPSDPNTTTTLDKYRTKVELSECCVVQ